MSLPCGVIVSTLACKPEVLVQSPVEVKVFHKPDRYVVQIAVMKIILRTQTMSKFKTSYNKCEKYLLSGKVELLN